MVRVAILADIHGNLPALHAVLNDLDTLAPDEILVGGDLVGRGPQGSAVVAQVRDSGWLTIRGNHEDYLLDFRHRRVPEDWWRRDEWAASRWMAAELEDEDVAFIDSLPYSTTSQKAPGLRLTHGTPRSANEGLGPWSSDRILRGHLEAIDEDLLVVAHTHRPMRRQVPGGEVINVGSVGLPFNGDPRAQYAVLTYRAGSWIPEFRQVEYDLERTLTAYRDSGFLAAGGVTAELLGLELRRARPFLVPFIAWARSIGAEPASDRVGEFLELYDPEQPMEAFFDRMRTASVAAD